jgi:nitrate/nitrite-specific signal transduction histidine kinase
MMEEMNAKMDANYAELRSIIRTFRPELKETIQREMRAAIQSVQSELDETTACNEATD